jgi:hypothetical protein
LKTQEDSLMFRAICSWLVLTMLATPAWAKLEIRDIKAAYGPLGPERTSLAVVPGDQIFFRYAITGIRTDAAGRAEGELRLQVTDTGGKVLIDNKEAIGGLLALGGQTLPGTAQVSFGPDTPAGDYKLRVTISDKLGADSASFERTLTCTKPAFALVRLRFSQDAEGNIASAAGGTLGQTLYIHCQAVGFERTKTKLRVVFTLQVLDMEGKPLMPKPVRAELAPEDAEQIAKLELVDFKGLLVLNRAGEFRLHLSATDELSKQKAEFVAPLRVTAP